MGFIQWNHSDNPSGFHIWVELCSAHHSRLSLSGLGWGLGGRPLCLLNWFLSCHYLSGARSAPRVTAIEKKTGKFGKSK